MIQVADVAVKRLSTNDVGMPDSVAAGSERRTPPRRLAVRKVRAMMVGGLLWMPMLTALLIALINVVKTFFIIVLSLIQAIHPPNSVIGRRSVSKIITF